MSYLTVKQLSKKWGISERRIINLCREDRINGAVKNGMVWMIPEDTVKPADKRTKIEKYINTQKRVLIINIDNEIGAFLIPLLEKEGYIVEGTYSQNNKLDINFTKDILVSKLNYQSKSNIENFANNSSKYYDGLIFINLEKTPNKDLILKLFSTKMNSSSSIVLVDKELDENKNKFQKVAKEFQENIGLRINSINLIVPKENYIIINYDEIAEDIVSLFTKFKNTTGVTIKTDGGCLEFYKTGRTAPMKTGKYYRAIDSYFKKLNKQSYMWCASTMLEDEWTEEPLEMNFRVTNLEAANRGVTIDRIFIFSKTRIQEFKNNKTLKIYMQSNINTMFVDYDEVITKEPELIKIVGNGWDGINKETLIVDLPEEKSERGYISINKKEVQKAYDCFQKLKKYAKDLKEVLK